MKVLTLAAAMSALYAAEIELTIASQWDAGWLVELVGADGTRATRHFAEDEIGDLLTWIVDRADDINPGWRTAAAR